MLQNYIKIAWKVLKRRKFFTFVSLFGISFTLMVLMVFVAFLSYLISPNIPDAKRDRSLYLMSVKMLNAERTSISQGPAGFYLLKNYVKPLKSPENVSLYSLFEAANTFSNNQKLTLNYRYTDAEYWEIFEFEFIEGKPYTQKELDRSDFVVVIGRTTRDNYFGKDVSAVGKYIKTNGKEYRVIGVVEDVPITNIHCHADLFMPYTISPVNYETTQQLNGKFFCVVLAKDKDDFKTIQDEYLQATANVDIKGLHDFDIFESRLDTFIGKFTRTLFGNFEEDDDKSHILFLIIGIFMFLFMLLPAINLVNLNITRIMERASEIGARKAFGASNSHLIGQFLVENLTVTAIGGGIGLALTYVVIQLLNSSQVIPHMELSIDYNVFFIGLIICLFFGLMSGVYPAYRMSRLQAAEALKGMDK